MTTNSGLLPTANWFASVHPNDLSQQTGTLQGARGPASNVSGDAIVGSWIVQLSSEALATIDNPQAAEPALQGFGAVFSVSYGLGLPGQLLVQATPATRDNAAAALRSNPLVSSFEADT